MSRRLAVLEKRYYDRWAVLVLCSLGLFFTFSFSLLTLYRQQYSLALTLFACIAVQTGVLRACLKYGEQRWARWLCVLMGTVLVCLLFIGGGHAGTGPIWVIVFAPLVIALLGFRSGGLYGLLLILLLAGMSGLGWFEHQILDAAIYRNRVLLVLTFIGLYLWCLEYSRSKMVDRLLQSQQTMKAQAATDSLTGIDNRWEMQRQLDKQERRSSQKQEVYSLIVADIDHFKRINDRHGHQCGDQVIGCIAGLVKSSLRADDRLARWGGEEFLLMLPATNLSGALDVAEKLRARIEQFDMETDAGSLRVTMSFGVAEGDPGGCIEDAIKLADQGLYLAKAQGRNHVAYCPQDTEWVEIQQQAVN